ncbi:MAG TPA: hypothetical protein VK603_21450 [Candidatus Saccharimonadales bacterium]|nr:hypothetical protein [Candidatus Saccharimonadales bacterium]
MEYRALIIALIFVLNAIPAWAFETRKPQRDEHRLRIELEAVPSPAQENMDRYVRDLAADAQKEATPEERARKDDAAKERQGKVINPLPLFRW